MLVEIDGGCGGLGGMPGKRCSKQGWCTMLVMVVVEMVQGRGRLACRPRLPSESWGASYSNSPIAGGNLHLTFPPASPTFGQGHILNFFFANEIITA